MILYEFQLVKTLKVNLLLSNDWKYAVYGIYRGQFALYKPTGDNVEISYLSIETGPISKMVK